MKKHKLKRQTNVKLQKNEKKPINEKFQIFKNILIHFLAVFFVIIMAFVLWFSPSKSFNNYSYAISQQATKGTQLAVFKAKTYLHQLPKNEGTCNKKTPFFPIPLEPRMETSLDLDLSQKGKPYFISITMSSNDLIYMADNSIKAIKDLKVWEKIIMTGDKVAVVLSVEHKLHIPKPVERLANGDIYTRVIGTSKRHADILFNIYTPVEKITTTPEHPFYVNKKWVEARNLKEGDIIYSSDGSGGLVLKTETLYEPQMVYSLLIEGAHNFYVGEGRLLAHNCTLVPKKVLRDYPTGKTKNWSANFKSEADARALARKKVGKNPEKIEPGKLRSQDGKWQYRAKPGDIKDKHVHIEELNPKTGEVLQNGHLRWK